MLPIALIIDHMVAIFDRTLPGISSNVLACVHSESSTTAAAGVLLVGDVTADGVRRNKGISNAGAAVALHLFAINNSRPPNWVPRIKVFATTLLAISTWNEL